MNSDETLNISAVLIVEVLGKPAEHLTESLKDIAERMGAGNGVSVSDSTLNPPVPLKEQEGIFTAFAEIEVNCESVNHLVALMFNFMPAHVEILTPEKISMSNNDWNDILNELGQRLHQYDGLAKMLQMEKNVLENKVKALSSELEEKKEKEPKKQRVQEGI
jgi:hypothetical protein